MIPDGPQSSDEDRRQDARAFGQESETPKEKQRLKPRPRRDNQEHLGVGRDHKTETMRKRHRGTFP